MQTFNSFTDLAAANGTKAYTGSFGSSNNADLDTVWDNSAILSLKVAAEYEEYKCLHESLKGAHSDDPHLRTKFPTVYEWQNMDEDWRASYLNDIRLNASLWKAMQESPEDFRNTNSADRSPSVFNEDTVTPEYEEYKQLIADANQMYVKRDMPPSPNFAPVPFENWQSMSPELRQEYMNDVRDGMKWMTANNGAALQVQNPTIDELLAKFKRSANGTMHKILAQKAL